MIPGTPADFIAAARAEGRTLLTEPEAKGFLAALGIPIPRGGVARTAEEAGALARGVGGAVALKIVAPGVAHKSRRGWVACPVPAVCAEAAFRWLVDRAAADTMEAPVEGVLVEEYRPGLVECVVGYARLPRFGPIVMCGLGGVLVEARAEVHFRLAPLHAEDAARLVAEVCDGLREAGGLPPAGREALVRALVQVAGIAANPALTAIREVDVNPLAVDADGAVALDALVTLEGERA